MPQRADNRVPRWLIVAILVAVTLTLATGGAVYHDQERSMRARAESDLQMVAEFKVNEISTWRTDRLADGMRVTEAPGIQALLAEWIQKPSPETRDALVRTLTSLRFGGSYREVLLVDTSGEVLLSATGDLTPLAVSMLSDLRTAFSTHAPLLTDLHTYADDSGAHLDVIAPVYIESPDDVDTPRAAGAIVLRADARDFLYPLIKTWPSPSQTAETLLVRREGPEVLFLNEVRHVTGTAMSLRIPLTELDVPAVKAVLGQRGIVDGLDYRGEPVVSFLAEIPDSPWLMVAKVDAAEAYAPWRARARFLVAIVALIAASAIGMPLLLWHQARGAQLSSMIETERLLRAAEARLGVTLASIGDGVIATDVEGIVQFINPVAVRLTGWPEPEAVGQPLAAVYDVRTEHSDEPAASPLMWILASEAVSSVGEQIVLVSRDGTVRPIGDSGAPIRDESGEITGIVIVFRDQTDERAIREQLRQSAQRYQELFDSMLDGFAVHEMIYDDEGRPADYRFITVNPAFERLTKLSADLVVGKRILDVLPGTEPEWIERYGSVALTGVPIEFELHSAELGMDFEVYAFRPREGQFAVVFQDVTEKIALRRELEAHTENLERLVEERTEELQATNEELAATNEELQATTEELQAANEELYATNEELQATTEELHATNEELHAATEQLIAANHTLRATTEELAESNRRLASANEAKSRFLRAMSHELRTPLNSIIGFSGLMLAGLSGDFDEEQRSQLEMIEQAGRHLLALINDILDLSRIEAGRVQVAIEAFDLERLVTELVESVRPEADRKGLALELAIAGDLDLSTFHSDSMRVGQIVLNLLANAVKFTEAGSISVRVGMLGTDTLGISVTDTGPGIRAEDHERIFGEFVQAGGPARPNREGTGLGLAISRRLSELLGGSILLRSRPGHGSTFTLVLPVDPNPNE